MDDRLVFFATSRRRAEGLLHSRKSPRRTGERELRSAPAGDPHSTQGGEGRLASVRTQLLPPLSPGRAPRAAGRYLGESYRFPLHSAQRRRSLKPGAHGPRRRQTTATANLKEPTMSSDDKSADGL